MKRFVLKKIKQFRCHHNWVQNDYKLLRYYPNDYIYDGEGNRIGYIPIKWKVIYKCQLCGKRSTKYYKNGI